MEKQNSYSHILKYTGIFGGVQGLNILIGLVRNKLVAMILGPTGMGVVALFTSTAKLVGDATNLGLPMSAVREISEAYESGDESRTQRLVGVFRMWSTLTSLAGMLICIALSPLLNAWTFSFGNHILHFVYLSPVVALTTLTACEMALLKATRRLHDIAVISIYSVVAALVISVPVYFFFGMSGVIPVLVFVALAQSVITLFFSLRLYPLRLSFNSSFFREGAGLVKLGLAFVAGCVFGSAAEFSIRSYLNYVAQVEVVGLYNAAYMMIVTYAGMIFTAMETDYYPRLSAIPAEGAELNETVNKQIEVSLVLLSPMLLFFVVYMPVLLPLLFSSKFMPVLPMLQIAALSMFARALFLPIEYISLSRADSFSYLFVEFFSYAMLVVSVIVGYKYWGLIGTGVAMTLSGFAELLMVVLFYRVKYKFSLSRRALKIVGVQLALGVVAYGVSHVANTFCYWSIGTLLCMASLAYSLIVIRSQTDILDNLKQKIFNKFRR